MFSDDAALAFAGNMISGAMNYSSAVSDKKAAKTMMYEQMDYNSAEAQKARDWQMKMFNASNEYNSPSNQRKLMEQAGFNPYQLGAQFGSTSAAASAPSTSSASAGSLPNYQRPDFGFFAQAAMDAAQIDLMRAEANKTQAEANNIDLDAETNRAYLRSMTGLNDAEIGRIQQLTREVELNANWLEVTFDMRVDDLSKAIDLKGAQKDLFDKQISIALYQLEQIMPLERDQLYKYVNEVMPKEIKLLEEKIMTEGATREAACAQAACSYANAMLYKSMKSGQDTKNKYDKAILLSDDYQHAVIEQAQNDAEYAGARAFNEGEGYPYYYIETSGVNISAGAERYGKVSFGTNDSKAKGPKKTYHNSINSNYRNSYRYQKNYQENAVPKRKSRRR